MLYRVIPVRRRVLILQLINWLRRIDGIVKLILISTLYRDSTTSETGLKTGTRQNDNRQADVPVKWLTGTKFMPVGLLGNLQPQKSG
jgi:hypothetical protein